VLGAQWVAGHADAVLSRAAADLIAKIAETVPERLRPFVLEPASRARSGWRKEPDRIDMARPGHRFTKEKRSRCTIATNRAATASARSGQSPSAISKQCGSWRHGANCARISAAFEPTASSTPYITTRNIPSGAICCEQNGEEAWFGNIRAKFDRCYSTG